MLENNDSATLANAVKNTPHSKLHNIMLVATKVHVTLKSSVVLTWMRDKRELV